MLISRLIDLFNVLCNVVIAQTKSFVDGVELYPLAGVDQRRVHREPEFEMLGEYTQRTNSP